jgi:hypothetical protein
MVYSDSQLADHRYITATKTPREIRSIPRSWLEYTLKVGQISWVGFRRQEPGGRS